MILTKFTEYEMGLKDMYRIVTNLLYLFRVSLLGDFLGIPALCLALSSRASEYVSAVLPVLRACPVDDESP